MGSITKLNVKHTRKSAPRTIKRANNKQRNAMIGVGCVALTLTALSLTHLTCGIAQVTGGSTLESAAMAIGIDAGFIALEVAQVVKVSEQVAKVISRYAPPAIMGTMLASAALNAFGFASHAQGVMLYPAVALGCTIPALIYALTRVAVAMSK